MKEIPNFFKFGKTLETKRRFAMLLTCDKNMLSENLIIYRETVVLCNQRDVFLKKNKKIKYYFVPLAEDSLIPFDFMDVTSREEKGREKI